MRIRLFFTVIMILLFLGTAVTAFYGWTLFQPVNVKAQEKQKIVVAKGDTLTKIATTLESQGIIKSHYVFRLLAKQQGDPVVQPGSYEVSPAMSTQEILTILQKETQDVWITLLEGWRTEEMATELSLKLSPSFDKDAFIQITKNKEGTFFPDTYLLPREATAESVSSLLTTTFQKRYKTALDAVGPSVFSKDETIVLASLVQREAKHALDMKIVAGILKNRIEKGMPLQVDATLQYVKGYDAVQQTWWQEPKSEDKELNSPFNTYKNPGLPPSPICNPGLDALEAAIRPDTSSYYFYISDRQGDMHYAKTFDEHKANIQRYLR